MGYSLVVPCHSISLIFNFLQDITKICKYFVFEVQKLCPFFQVKGSWKNIDLEINCNNKRQEKKTTFISRTMFFIFKWGIDKLQD